MMMIVKYSIQCIMNDDSLQILTGKTWDFHARINEKITQNSFSFCSHCSNHGRYCVVADKTKEEREKMIAIRDSLKDLHNNLVYLQRVKSRQKKQRDEALGRLEESRRVVIERISDQWPNKERRVDVIEEINTFLGHQFPKDKGGKVSIFSFLVQTSRFALEFGVMFASIYMTVALCNKKRQQRETINSRMLSSNNIQLDVLCGRG
ncbi:hypothetical protein Salat_2272900 [Sesamum alatum]|uniref:Uncharacterized protein n=1 Tax=Sesamum alatum TaxID=300844 RepID=A0AAE1XV24_9LAMI|nr:hypothetical protein Salat_2272900 [Sesamum alatum]